MSDSSHLRINTDYTTAIIEDLQKFDAIELVSEEDASNDYAVKTSG